VTKKNYNCQVCDAPVYLTMIYCDQCGSELYIDPNREVYNLAVVSIKTEELPLEERCYQLQYETPFNAMEELLRERQKYDSRDQQQKKILIYGSHLIYIYIYIYATDWEV